MKTAIEKMVDILEFMKSKPAGGPSGENLSSRMYLHAIEHMLIEARALALEETQERKAVECQRCEGLGYRTVPDGEGHIIQEPCDRCGGKPTIPVKEQGEAGLIGAQIRQWWDLYCETDRPGCIAKEELFAICDKLKSPTPADKGAKP